MRRLISALLLLAMVWTSAAPVWAADPAEQADQTQPNHDGSQDCYLNYACAQVFTAGLSGYLSAVDLKVEHAAGTGDLVVELRELSSGQPTGTALAAQTVAASQVPPVGSGAAFTRIDLSDLPLVEAGTQYAIVVHAGGDGQYKWYDQESDAYADGTEWLQAGSGNWVEYAGWDFAFTTYVTPVQDNAQLSGLTLSAGNLSPNFDPATYDYQVDLPNSDSSVTVNAIPEDSGATVTVNGKSVPASISLAEGPNAIAVVVTAADGSTQQTYNINAHRNALPTITGLSDLTTLEGQPTQTASFTVGDLESDPATLEVTGLSQSPSLVDSAAVVIGGAGANRTVQVTPKPGVTGTATIAISVDDGTDVRTALFQVEIRNVNDPPALDPIPAQSTPEDTPRAVALTLSDPDGVDSLTVSATSSDQSLVPNSGLVASGSGASRTLTVTPAAEASGTATITVTVSDGLLTAIQTFDLTVTPVDDPPVIAGLTDKTIQEDSDSFSFTFTVADDTLTADQISVVVASETPSIIPDAFTVAKIGATVSVAGAPARDAHGVATIRVTASAGGLSRSETIAVTVSNVNDAPTINPLSDVATLEDTPTAPILVTVDDIDTDLDSLTLTPSTGNATLVPVSGILFGGTGANRTAIITPAPDQNGATTITLRVSDGQAYATRTFNLTVVPVNDPPSLGALQDVSVAAGSPVPPIAVSVSDLETPAASLIVTATSSNTALVPGTSVGVTGSGSTRTVVITPAAGQTGQTEITVTVSDGVLTTTDTFWLTVSQKPDISAMPDIAIDEDTATGVISFVVSDAETPADALQVTAASSNQALVPMANLSLGGSGSNRTLVITPAPNGYGVAAITVTVNDGTLTNSRTFTLTVRAVNDPPSLSSFSDLATNEDVPAGPIPFTVADVETAPGSLTVTATSDNPLVVPDANIVKGGSGTTRSLTIIPAPEASGVAVITVTVSDGAAAASQSFVITVTAVNDPPKVTMPGTVSVQEEGSATFAITAVDTDGPGGVLTLTVVSMDQNVVPQSKISTAGGDGAWTVQVTPEPDRSGLVPLQVTVSDGQTAFVGSLMLNVTEVNDPPGMAGLPAALTTAEDTPVTGVPFTAWDIETPPDNLEYYTSSDNPALAPPSAFTFSGSGNARTMTVTPARDEHGTATVTVYVDDGVDRVSQSFVLTVTPVPDAPSLQGVEDRTINEDAALSLPVVLYDPDSPMEAITYSITSDNPALVSDIQLIGTGVNRTLKITPAENANGSALITVTLSDESLANVQTMLLTVNPVNDYPVVSVISDLHILEDGSTGPLPFTVGDVETDANGLEITLSSSDQNLVPDANIALGGSGVSRDVTVTPAPDRTGRATITVRVNDGTVSASETFQVTVDAVNDAPSFTPGPDVVVDEDAGPQSLDWATQISQGPFETGQTLAFEVTHDNPALFALPPAMAKDGTLSFTSAEHAYGTARVQVRLVDNGGTANGGRDASDWTEFTITVNSVNDLPTITAIPDQGTEEGVATDPLPFTIGDVESSAGYLWVTGRSDNQSLVPDTNIRIEGTGAERTVQVTPVAGQIGTAIITLTVHDPDGGATDMSFPLVVNNLRLSDLTSEKGTITPAFDPHTLSYTVIYTGNETEMRVTPTTSDPNVEILVNDVPTLSGHLSEPFPLANGGGSARIVVYAPVTGIMKQYTLRYVRALSKNTDLAGLAIDPGELSPEFSPAVTRYSASVPYEVTGVAVDAVRADGRARLEISGGSALNVGANLVRITVIAENGERKVYEIVVTRGRPSLTIEDVAVEAGSQWATIRFRTNDSASATVAYGPVGEPEQSVSAGGGTDHSATLRDLAPATAYTFRISLSGGDGSAPSYSGTFYTQFPSAADFCPGGAITSNAPLLATVRCPGDAAAAETLRQALDLEGSGLTPSTVPEEVMREALKQAGAAAGRGEAATVVIQAAGTSRHQAALLDPGSIQRAVTLGAAVEVRSDLGSIALPPTALAELLQSQDGQLVISFAEVPAERPDLRPWVSDDQYSRASAVVEVTVTAVYADGRVERKTSFAEPVRLALKVEPAALADADRLGAYWLTEDGEGKITSRVYVGGQVDREAGTIAFIQDHLSKFVVMRFAARFRDVPADHWAHDVIQIMASRQVVRGTSPDRFEPEAPVTRAQFAAMLVRAFNLDRDSRFAYIFRDVGPANGLAKEIGGAVMAGLMMGYPDNTFRPDQLITRQELAIVLARVAGYRQLELQSTGLAGAQRVASLQDWDAVAPWAAEAVRSTVGQGWMSGRGGGLFTPEGNTTRAEAVTVIHRLMQAATRMSEPQE